jgi:hypothetical protein
LLPEGANGLAHAHLFGPVHGPRRGQVDVIDPGNGQDKKGDEQQEVHRPAVAVCLGLLVEVRMEVNAAERL